MIVDAYENLDTAKGIAAEIEAMTMPFTADDVCDAQHPFSTEKDPNLLMNIEADPHVQHTQPMMPKPTRDGSTSGTSVPVRGEKESTSNDTSSIQTDTAERAAHEENLKQLSKRQIVQCTDNDVLCWMIEHDIQLNFPSTLW